MKGLGVVYQKESLQRELRLEIKRGESFYEAGGQKCEFLRKVLNK